MFLAGKLQCYSKVFGKTFFMISWKSDQTLTSTIAPEKMLKKVLNTNIHWYIKMLLTGQRKNKLRQLAISLQEK